MCVFQKQRERDRVLHLVFLLLIESQAYLWKIVWLRSACVGKCMPTENSDYSDYDNFPRKCLAQPKYKNRVEKNEMSQQIPCNW